MPSPSPAALSLTRTVLRTLLVLNLVMGFLIAVLLVASIVAEGPVGRALGVRPDPGERAMTLGMQAIMAIGIAAVPLTQRVLRRLLDVVDTVRAGNPFVAVNALRLRSIAWALLGLEVLHLLVGAAARLASSPAQKLDLGWSFSFSGWLAVLLLFVLARVFELGTGMRDELEGTV